MNILEYIFKNWILFIIAIGYFCVLLVITYTDSKLHFEGEEVQNKYLKAINRKSFFKSKHFIAGKLSIFIILLLIDIILNKEVLIYWLIVLLFSNIINKLLWRKFKKTEV